MIRIGGNYMLKHLKLNLTLFDGEGGGESGAPAVSSDMGENDTSQVATGEQENHDDSQSEQSQIVDEKTRQANFDKFLKENKDLFSKKTQEIINKRFKETKQLESQIQKVNPVLEMLSSRYGVDASNIDELMEAISNDDVYLEDEALERGMTIEQLKSIKALERENARYREMYEQQQKQEQAQRTYNEWLQAGEQLKEIYPSFDFESELQENENFGQLLKNGIDVRTAFEVCHRDEILGGAMAYTAQQVKQKVANDIQARGQRPSENGMNSQSSVGLKFDINKTTKAEREEFERRALRGERITFR
jgi:hypothetical protein